MRTTLSGLLVLVLTAACAGDGTKVPDVPAVTFDSPIPGTIGVAVTNRNSAVVVVAVRAGGAAARADVREGDRISGCNGKPVADALDFERRILDARPGSLIELEVVRGTPGGTTARKVSLPVEEILTAVQA